ncbi:MAG: tetratricopeptide repeat protein [Pseudomonadota bacterium]
MGRFGGPPALVLAWALLPLGVAASNAAWGQAVFPSPAASSAQDWNRSLLARGHDSERLGAKDDALADYTLAIESGALTGDDQVRALFDRGLLLDAMGRLREAADDYSSALLLSPNFAAARNNRAEIYRRLGRLPEARRDYLAAIATGSPQSQYSYYGLGQIAEMQGKKADAEALYRCALAADPHYNLASERLAALSGGSSPLPVSAPEPAAPNHASELAAIPSTSFENKITQSPIPMQIAVEHGVQVQLGAWRSLEKASKGWSEALQLAGETLEGLSPRIVAVDLPGAGRYYRLRVAANLGGSRALCMALVAKGVDCIPARDR